MRAWGVKRFAAAVLMLGFALSAAAPAAGTYRIAAVMGSFGAIDADRFEVMAREIMDIVGKKIGEEFEVVTMETDTQVFEALTAGEADMAIGVDYARGRALGVPIAPWAALEYGGELGFRDCLWAAADSPFETVAQLEGKSMVFRPTVNIRKILFDAGFDTPIHEFFSEVHMYADPLTALNGLLEGRYHTALMGSDYMGFLMFDDNFRKGIKQVACTETLMPLQFFRHRDLDPEIKEKLDLVILNAHRDPAFKTVHFVFISMNAKLVLTAEEDYEPNVELYREAAERGWIDEIQPYIDELDALLGS